MTTFTITTDNVAVVKAIMGNIEGLDNIQVTAAAPVTPTDATPVNPATDTPTPVNPATDVITSDVVAGIIKTLADMSADDLVSTFGAGYDKPYRVLKAFSFEDIKAKIISTPIITEASMYDIKNAVDVIIKDVSDGGLSHDAFEDMFNVRTSKKLFQDFTLDQIVNTLKDNEYI